METINVIKKKYEDKLSALFESLGIFFAFSQQQFDEKKKEGVTYVAGDLGMIIPKENVKAYYDTHNKQIDEEIAEFNADVPMDDYIRYELANHECFYTGNYGEILELLQIYYPDCTMKDIKRVYFTQLEAETK